ncbi:ALPHA-GLUCOSIDASE [Salix purpurea]|uniref:ALPHA-GLUCOSIDASE n=1 Tax=Salix purpurea TaxID=77065 RepID=A0A9Q0YW69_SALPP|nr:ALPHA-GLUCOSIDASE [Salix purpurea]
MADHDQAKVVAADVVSRDMIFQPILEDGVFRFDCSAEARVASYPSLSFICSKDRDTPIMSHSVPSYTPTYECVSGKQIVKFKFPDGTSFYGTGEVSGQLERTGKRVFTWNTDAWGYGPGTTSLYQSHPWVLAVLPNGEALGVLADTTLRCEIDLRKESIIQFIAPSSYPVVTFGPFASPTDVLKSFVSCHWFWNCFGVSDVLIWGFLCDNGFCCEYVERLVDKLKSREMGMRTVFMPPKWSLGYQQCRWSYDSDERVREIARTFREKGIPCDVIWMDIDYMDGFRCFTFDQERFRDPQSLVKDLHDDGFKAIWMLDPGIKKEEGYFVYDSGSKNDVWIKKADGEPFVGEVWPGPCVFPDFTQSKVRAWWAALVKDFTSNGVDGIWNDMNEPAVFKTVTKTMPESNFHLGDEDIGGCQNHTHYHNVYGMLMARSTYEGMKLANENKRPFVLTRAGFIGSQRHAATWTGDNLSNWEHLHMSLSMVLQLGLSGQPLSGPDIGGFAGNATPKLFGRWMGVGAMFPFCRGHSEKRTNDHEPWSFGEECEEVCRLALKRRYRLLLHIYTLFYLAHTTGTLVATPTFFADPKDPGLRTTENSFLLGPLLVYSSTIADQGMDRLHPVLPKGIWLRFDFDDSHPDLPTLYLQGGSIIPLAPPHQHVGEANLSDDLTLLVALDQNGHAEGLLFEDEGDGYEFTRGGYLLTRYVAKLQSSAVTVSVSQMEGSWKRPRRRLHVQLLLGGGAMLDSWGIDGDVVKINMPTEVEVSSLVSTSEKQYRTMLECAKHIPELEEVSGPKGVVELSKDPVELKNGDWIAKIVPWIGGRIISMEHLPSGTQWLHSRVEIDGYEEYSGTEYRSAGCTEEYSVIERDLEHAGKGESLILEGDIGGGLVLRRQISLSNDNPKILQIDSGIIARSVGAGSGGFSRLVCLRVHPMFSLLHPTETFVSFTSIDGSKHEIWPESGDQFYQENLLPNGEWMLVDQCQGLALVNRFNINEVYQCYIHWGTGTVKSGAVV